MNRLTKRIIAAVMSFAAAFLIIAPQTQIGRYSNLNAEAAEYTYNCSYVYDMLDTQEEKAFYNRLQLYADLINTSTADYETMPMVPYADILTHDRAIEVAWLFFYDHPEYFWMDSGLRISNTSLRFNIISDFRSGTARTTARTQIFNVVNQYLKGASEYSSQYDIVKYFHDELIQNISYKTGDWDQTIASVFLKGQTVCAGYAKAFSLLCNYVGIDTVVLKSPVHGWNAVKIDGHWYLVDVTNDYSSYTFFLISDSQMRSIDINSGAKYTATIINNGVQQSYEFYMHDIDESDYPDYYDQFPQCPLSYQSVLAVESGMGDANGDGRLAASDAAFIAKLIAQASLSGTKITVQMYPSADFNSDGQITAFDAALIAKYIAEKALAG